MVQVHCGSWGFRLGGGSPRRVFLAELLFRQLADQGLWQLILENDLARQLRFAGPWGQSFPEPEFEGEFAVESWKVVGEKHLKFKLCHAGVGIPLDAIAFNSYSGEAPPTRLHAVFQLDVNEWNGRQSLLSLLRDLRACG